MKISTYGDWDFLKNSLPGFFGRNRGTKARVTCSDLRAEQYWDSPLFHTLLSTVRRIF